MDPISFNEGLRVGKVNISSTRCGNSNGKEVHPNRRSIQSIAKHAAVAVTVDGCDDVDVALPKNGRASVPNAINPARTGVEGREILDHPQLVGHMGGSPEIK